ncbi:ABC transporter permease [Muricomes sp. OA1]|uniref:ABC transporter permease n=1 Tax=Hungatella hathewayi TaxID=154046 RepID=A0A3E2WIK4_9FIRM|nr:MULTISPECIES: ABC transporter permease [Clostridia]MEE0203350.1 ABC transporter permease [Muricomes sp.]MCH1974333.1 ABC transporter permease [Muricomes sp. OA1]MRM90452.1 ABC transporter permease [Faecalicatena contorta]RGC26281.1 ABC transporter permease [Hungatella hathewayi]GKH33109.1 hypothetical protein CE91St64_25160 [Faecalicatena contorta]
MTVFKGYMKIVKANVGLMLMYLAIFFGITMMIQAVTKDTGSGSYSAESVHVGIVDEDGGALAKGLKEYLGQFHNLTMIDNDKEKLQESLFYRELEYIVKIPAGFEKKCLEGGEKLEVTKVPGSYTSFYVDQQITSFLNSVKTYYAAGYSASDAVDAALERQGAEITMLDINGNAGEVPGYTYYFRYIPYLMMSVLCYVLGNILSAFHKGDIPKRMQACAVSNRRQNLEALLAAGLMGGALWAVCMLGNLVLYGKAFLKSSSIPYYLLNSLAVLLVVLALAYLVGMLTNNTNALNGIVNTVSLGMCFLCGVFVPLDVLNKGVITVAQFLPVYWYEKANDMLADFGNITGSVRTEVLQAVGIQLVFAAAILCIAMAVSKKKKIGA